MCDRCAVEAGDFFVAVPEAGDVYLLANVLEDWPDEEARKILERCREAMSDSSVLLILENNVEAGWSQVVQLFDVEQMAVVGGKERTSNQIGQLLEACHLRARECRIVGNEGFVMIEAVRKRQ